MTYESMMIGCPLCLQLGCKEIFKDEQVNKALYGPKAASFSGGLPFYFCGHCTLTFKDRNWCLNLEAQKRRYDDHQNEMSTGYEAFLRRLWTPMTSHLQNTDHGLDYGCGPTKAMESIVRQDGFFCDSYDPLFWHNPALLNGTYNFVTCSEVVEHFVNVNSDWKQLRRLLKSNSILGVMTAFTRPDLSNWHYHRDPTHVSFYSPQTMDWIAKSFGFEIMSCQDDVTVFRAV